MAGQCTRTSVNGSGTAVNVAAKSKRRGKLLSAERSSLLAGLVDTQWFSLWFSWMPSHTDTNACVMAGLYCIATAVSTLQALLPRGDPSVLKKQQHLMFAVFQGLLRNYVSGQFKR